MDIRPTHINRLKLAEQQFRLACTVHLALANDVQTLDVPVEWTFGRHRVSYDDFGLRHDQADLAASLLELTATLVLSGTIRDAIAELFPNAKSHTDERVKCAYQISRMLRNAFAHSFVSPRWSIDADCRDKTFAIAQVIELNTAGLHDQFLDWRHYGGPLAIFAFGRFVRTVLLEDMVDPGRAKPPLPSVECYQQGRLIAHRVAALPERAEVARAGPHGRINLGDGHYLVPLLRET